MKLIFKKVLTIWNKMLDNLFNQIDKNEIIHRVENRPAICIIKSKEGDEDCLFDLIPQYEVRQVINSTSSTMSISLIGHY